MKTITKISAEEIKKKVNQIRHLKQFKSLSEEELLKMAEEKITKHNFENNVIAVLEKFIGKKYIIEVKIVKERSN